MSNLDDYLHTHYSYNMKNSHDVTYPYLRDFDAEKNGQPLLDDNNDVIVTYLHPNETFDVTLYYDTVTMCTKW